MTIAQSLKSLNAYPLPADTLSAIAAARGLNPDGQLTDEVRQSSRYILARADIYSWLAQAPDIMQADISYKFSDTDRKEFRLLATSLYGEGGIEISSLKPVLGYKGELL